MVGFARVAGRFSRALTSRARRVPRRHDGQARVAPARMPRRGSRARPRAVTRGARASSTAAPRAPAASPRAWLDGQWRRHGARAPARLKARAPSRRFAGRPGAAPSVASGNPRVQVGPRTSRPSHGMHVCSLKEWLSPHSARRVPRLCAPLPESRKVAPPDNGPVIVSRALWSAGTRAHAPVALPRNARERSFP